MRGRARVARWLMSTALLVCMAELPRAAAQTAVSTAGSIEGSISTQQTTALAGVTVKIIDATGHIVADASTDMEGRFRVTNLPAGTYRVMAALDGFETTTRSVVVTHERAADITVDLPIARFADTIDVVGETAAVSSGQTLAPVEAVASRELDQFVPGQGFQGAIRMLATAIPVPGGVSIKGGRPGQAGVQLGTMTLVDPASGVAQVPLPDGAIESVTVLPNPYAVEYGRFSSGLVVIQSRRASDQWKFRANRFGPSLRSTSDGSLRIDGYSPRAEIGGPLVRDRVYLAQSAQVRYSIGDVSSRAETEQRVTKAVSSFSRVDANLSPRHLVIGTLGLFPNVVDFATVGTFTPPEASVNLRFFGKQVSLTERALWTNRTVSETTFQWFQSRTDVDPQGTSPMELQPDVTLGNFFNRQHRTTSSYQVVHAVTGHRDGFGGSHMFKVGVDLLHTQYDGTSQSQTVLIERADGAVVRRLDFPGSIVESVQTIGGTEAALFAQDRLQPHPRWYVEAGLRVDRDGVLRRVNVSPRIGTAVLLTESGSVVLRGGWGLFVERTPSMAGVFTSFESAVDTRLTLDGSTAAPGVPVAQSVAPVLETPSGRTWDAGFDYRWSERWSFHVGALNREGRHELIVTPLVTGTSVERRLSSEGRSSYRDVEVSAHYTRGATADVEATYTRSRSEGDLNTLTSSFDSVLAPIIGDNEYAALNTDVPHRLFVRGRVVPRAKWLLLGVFDWRTGLPYSVVNQTLDFVGPRNALRFPNYCRLELGLERRIKVFRFQPWVGVRLNNVLGQSLPDEVQNNTGSPYFGGFYNSEPRRIRVAVRFER
jgi:TonB dependent receptor/Carboxypeptidase regulatory-like domain